MLFLFLTLVTAIEVCDDNYMSQQTARCNGYSESNCHREWNCMWCHYDPAYICGGTRRVLASCEFTPSQPCYADQPCSIKINGSTPGGMVRSIFSRDACYQSCMISNSSFAVNSSLKCPVPEILGSSKKLSQGATIAIIVIVVCAFVFLLFLFAWWLSTKKKKPMVGENVSPSSSSSSISSSATTTTTSSSSQPHLQRKVTFASSVKKKEEDDDYPRRQPLSLHSSHHEYSDDHRPLQAYESTNYAAATVVSYGYDGGGYDGGSNIGSGGGYDGGGGGDGGYGASAAE